MKKILLSAAALTVLFAACSKSDDDNNASSTWKVGGTSYTALTVSEDTSLLIGNLVAVSGTGNNVNSFAIIFDSAIPTANGTYKIVSSPDSSNEVSIWAINTSGSSMTSYTSSDWANANATVTVSGGKVSVSVPEVWAINDDNASDSVKISGSITQN